MTLRCCHSPPIASGSICSNWSEWLCISLCWIRNWRSSSSCSSNIFSNGPSGCWSRWYACSFRVSPDLALIDISRQRSVVVSILANHPLLLLLHLALSSQWILVILKDSSLISLACKVSLQPINITKLPAKNMNFSSNNDVVELHEDTLPVVRRIGIPTWGWPIYRALLISPFCGRSRQRLPPRAWHGGYPNGTGPLQHPYQPCHSMPNGTMHNSERVWRRSCRPGALYGVLSSGRPPRCPKRWTPIAASDLVNDTNLHLHTLTSFHDIVKEHPEVPAVRDARI